MSSRPGEIGPPPTASPRMSGARRCCGWPTTSLGPAHADNAEAGAAPAQRVSFKPRGAFNRMLSRGQLPASRRHRRLGRQSRRRGGLCRPGAGGAGRDLRPRATAPGRSCAGSRATAPGWCVRRRSLCRGAPGQRGRGRRETGALQVHAYDHAEVLAGQGTRRAGVRRADAPDLTHVLVATGGGGLIGGMAAWYAGSGVRVVSVEPEGCPTLHARCAAGSRWRRRSAAWPPTAWARARCGSLMFAVASAHVARRCWCRTTPSAPRSACCGTRRGWWRNRAGRPRWPRCSAAPGCRRRARRSACWYAAAIATPEAWPARPRQREPAGRPASPRRARCGTSRRA